jgi:hypothetical protein
MGGRTFAFGPMLACASVIPITHALKNSRNSAVRYLSPAVDVRNRRADGRILQVLFACEAPVIAHRPIFPRSGLRLKYGWRAPFAVGSMVRTRKLAPDAGELV